MDRLCDEVIQLIFYELNDPSPLTLVSKRLYHFSQDPYVRAHYFLTRYGPVQAMFYALGRGKIITERVLDILLTSGAHLSRYLIQIAIHHFFRTQAHFIKTTWVRSVPFPVFTYFLKLSAEKYGEIPCGKGEDDGSLFASFLKESRFPSHMKMVNWEEISEILEKYKFIPFSNKDPIMAQFPLALAIEPRLLPLAVTNGFHMDSKYRDFVFRKMFERPAVTSDTRMDDIVHNVIELCRLDSTMFVSRTVAAEVCMEAKSNEAAYKALKQLDKSGRLLFELSALVEDLIKLFLKTRSITSPHTIQILRHLYADFPSSDPTVRLVLLLTIFLSSSDHPTQSASTIIKTKLEPLGLGPITRRDLYNVLVNPFVEKYHGVLEFARSEVGEKGAGGDGEGGTGMGPKEVRELVEEVALRCLEIGCKGKMLKRLYDGYLYLHEPISGVVLEKYQIGLEDLPSWEDEKGCAAFEGRLCRDFNIQRAEQDEEEGAERRGHEEEEESEEEGDEDSGEEGREDDNEMAVERVASEEGDALELGGIGQDSLTTMIRQDELAPVRARRRMYYPYGGYADSSGKLRYPHDPLQVGRWVKAQFGAKSSITAVFMTHAVINDNAAIFHHYLAYTDNALSATMNHVPITLKHFQLLARLGRAPNWSLYNDLELGAEFYFTEDDYLSKAETKKLLKVKVKTETMQGSIPISSSTPCIKAEPSSFRGKKRPRRMAAATITSYAVPDSDDEAIAGEEDVEFSLFGGGQERKKKRVETNLQRWIKHLGELLKEEQRKFKEKKKRVEMAADRVTKVRVPKSEFFKSLTSNLRNLRKIDEERRLKLYGPEVADMDYSDGDDDDEYQHHRTTRVKRRRTIRCS